jgi:hypothetical protein
MELRIRIVTSGSVNFLDDNDGDEEMGDEEYFAVVKCGSNGCGRSSG